MKKKNPKKTNKENLDKAFELGFIDDKTFKTHLEELNNRNTKNEKVIKRKTKELKKNKFMFTKEQMKLLQDTPIIILNPLTRPSYT